ncbi:MAG: GerMN domain-containing protein [Bacilli bacterium]|nr:GerMN domain-containing protein [Bacilli bacterium]
MLLRRSVKKIILSSFALLLLFLMYLIPNQKDKEYDYIVEYVNQDLIMHDIFLLDNNNYLAKTEIIVKEKEEEKLAKELIEDLIINSPNEDKLPSGFKAFLNENTKINSIEIIDDLIKIDFNDYLLDTKKNLEEKTIEAIIYNLTSIENINKVLIYINGVILNYLPKNKINIPSPLTREYGINKEYNLKKTKNITKTTIYYLNSFNNNEYYIPVTKINNDTSDKINIIIEELKDNNTLNSYLNYNTKLVSSEIKDNNMLLDFNEYILNDYDNLEILDEVLETINLSIHDNYNINDVIFKVNGKEIYKNKDKVLNN